jgi:hypothetical protein
VARFLWGSAATLLLVAVVLSGFVLNDRGGPTMRLNPSPLLDEAVAMVMVCGKQPTRATVNMTAGAVVRDRWTGERWARHRRGDCVVYYQHARNVD